MIIAVTNQKGGVAKTTTVLNLGAGLVKLKKKVLLIDLDPQASLTDFLGISTEGEADIYDLLSGSCKLKEVITEKEGMSIVPSSIEWFQDQRSYF